MQDSKSGTAVHVGPRIGRPKWLRALPGAAIAIAGTLATVHPTSAVLVALSEAVPQLASALPSVITAGGAILSALSDPPAMGRKK